MAENIVVFDFETTGGAPEAGDRPIEVGAVRIENDQIVDRFQRLMNPGFPISSFIESLTGISNDMVEQAPDSDVIMEEFLCFIEDCPLVAHNASFDIRFLDRELAFLNRFRENEYACSMLAARRVYPNAPNHKLSTLVSYCGIVNDGVYHRALADAEKTGRLWIAMIARLRNVYGIRAVPFSLMQEVSKTVRHKVDKLVKKYAQQEQRLLPGLLSNR